jgi:5-methylcytosine-specific restriction endonuclease McrA
MGDMSGRKTRTRRRADYYRDALERDGWQCQMPACLCPSGRAIDPALRGTNDPWAPSVDHIVERRQGGAWAAENVRAAHAKCNEAADSLKRAAEKKGWRIT